MGGSRTYTCKTRPSHARRFLRGGYGAPWSPPERRLRCTREITLSRDSLALTHTPRVAQASHAQ